MSTSITVVGGVNVDISAALKAEFIGGDSIPGAVTMGCGGVARNIAHNLRLLGNEVKFVSLFGGDTFGEMCWSDCQRLGFNLSMSIRREESRNGIYLCVNDLGGDMIAAVADTEIIDHLTPEYLSQHIDGINDSAAVVADTNISQDALVYLIDHCRVPLLVDAVSTAKAPRVIEALRKSESQRLHTLKLNMMEALAVTDYDTADRAALELAEMGVENVYITLGSHGAYCSNGEMNEHFNSLPVDEVVNTTGAGDAFLAGVTHALVNKLPFPLTAQFGLKTALATLLTPLSVNPELASIVL